MTEVKNFYPDPTDPNRNPIHVLRPNLPVEVSKIGPLFQEVVKGLLSSGKLLKDGVMYSEYNDPATKTPETAWGVIRLYDGFSVFLWALIYTMYVYHTEMTIKGNANSQCGNPLMQGVDRRKLHEAFALFDYGMSLLEKWDAWDETLPNPAVYPENKAKDIETVNSLFFQAMNFIIGHELAHLELGHTQVNPLPGLTSEEMEKQAYHRSFEFMQNGITKANEATTQIGLLSALCALLLCSRNLETIGYPDADDRIGAFIERINYSEDNDLWALAVLAFRLWDNHYQKGLFIPQNMHSQREVYYFIRSQLKREIKIEKFTLDITEGRFELYRARVGDWWQYQTTINDIPLYFQNNKNEKIVASVNTEFVDPNFLAELLVRLNEYNFDEHTD